MEDEPRVRLQCVSEKGRLRVRIVTSGYALNANCRFPRDIRVEGKYWTVPASAVKLQGKTKFYYTISTKNLIEVDVNVQILDISALKVYDVTSEGECVICSYVRFADDMIIIAPCGHKCACFECLSQCDKCPICRSPIERMVKPSELE